MNEHGDIRDLLVVGGGPAGATAAYRAARNGLRVTLFEQEQHPRFHIGESFLPRNLMLIRELGLEPRLQAIPRTKKLGASFVMGHESEPSHFHFRESLLPHDPEAFNIERAPFDAMLLEAARESGAEIVERTTVRRIRRLADREVWLEVRHPGGEERSHRGRYLVDASGQSSVVGRHLGTRRTLPDLKKVAYFGHFRNVYRDAGELGGYPLIVICSEGWFWLIPIDESRTSIGLVMDAEQARSVAVPGKEMLHWAIARCPHVRERTRNAVFPEHCGITADFSYSCRPYAGPGYFLVGDAATFVDPIFSTGVCLGMMSAVEAVDGIAAILRGELSPGRVQRRFQRYVDGSSAAFFRLVRRFYTHSFRELFLNREGPLAVHRAALALLCGHVFPRPPFSVRWRMRLMDLFTALNRHVPMVPRHDRFSLLQGGGTAAVDRAGGEPRPTTT